MEHGLCLIGRDFAQVTLYNLDGRYLLSRPEIPKKPERFVEAPRDMFGEGAQVIEKFIKQAMYEDGSQSRCLQENKPIMPYEKSQRSSCKEAEATARISG